MERIDFPPRLCPLSKAGRIGFAPPKAREATGAHESRLSPSEIPARLMEQGAELGMKSIHVNA